MEQIDLMNYEFNLYVLKKACPKPFESYFANAVKGWIILAYFIVNINDNKLD